MAKPIPEGLTSEHVLLAFRDLDSGIAHPFGSPTGYELVHEGRRYPPKAVVGLAFRHLTGEILPSNAFAGGEGSGRANTVLRNLGFIVEPITMNTDVRRGTIAILEDSIREEIIAHGRRMADEGKLPPRSQLEHYYATFRSRFGPERLAALDGEALLGTIHEMADRESLVYWLEFKNDDEFPSPRFGSIAGGSAFKFGMFRRKETGTWVTTDDKNQPRDLSVEEAVTIARRHRDQLVAGAGAFQRLPLNADDDAYYQLQQDLDRVAPELSGLAWAHKYFHLIFPDRLDDLHTVEWQRYLLIKLLQMPPEGQGRYLCGGRFIRTAAELNLPVNFLTTVLGAIHGGKRHRYWRVGTRSGDTKNSYWSSMREHGRVSVGWAELGDISWVESNANSREKLRTLLEEKYADRHASAVGNDISQITKFVAEMQGGDVILAADGATILGIGKISGDYEYESGPEFPHHRPVEWLDVGEWKMPTPEGLRSTVREIRRHPENLLAVERRIRSAGPIEVRGQPSSRPQREGRKMPRLGGIPGRIQSVLDRKGQVILYGPPGTGKTYWAEKAAFDLAAWDMFGKPFGDLASDERNMVSGANQVGGLVRLCCFHPAYGYEDFLEGYRPETHDGHVVFSLRDGIFKRLCKEAERTPNRRYYLIVDEINRGDIPRIFGELLTVLERDKRGKTVVLPVSQEPFRVPPNVYLIGTMNTADRSISLLDAALRRRFGFLELMPDPTVLRDHVVADIPLGAWFESLNRRVREHVGRDARNLQIGHSYLLDGGRPVKDLAALRRALRDEIVPLLEEYCYEDFAALREILGNAFIDVEMQQIRQDLFDVAREDELVQALMEPCPEIFTSSEAINAAEALSDAHEIEDPDGDDEP